jgi:hypothetical protein
MAGDPFAGNGANRDQMMDTDGPSGPAPSTTASTAGPPPGLMTFDQFANAHRPRRSGGKGSQSHSHVATGASTMPVFDLDRANQKRAYHDLDAPRSAADTVSESAYTDNRSESGQTTTGSTHAEGRQVVRATKFLRNAQGEFVPVDQHKLTEIDKQDARLTKFGYKGADALVSIRGQEDQTDVFFRTKHSLVGTFADQEGLVKTFNTVAPAIASRPAGTLWSFKFTTTPWGVVKNSRLLQMPEPTHRERPPPHTLSRPCAQCGEPTHTCGLCHRPDQWTGTIHACPVCNVRTHLIDTCRYLPKDPVARKRQLLFYLLSQRRNLPPIHSLVYSWPCLMLDYFKEHPGEKFVAAPWTIYYSLLMSNCPWWMAEKSVAPHNAIFGDSNVDTLEKIQHCVDIQRYEAAQPDFVSKMHEAVTRDADKNEAHAKMPKPADWPKPQPLQPETMQTVDLKMEQTEQATAATLTAPLNPTNPLTPIVPMIDIADGKSNAARPMSASTAAPSISLAGENSNTPCVQPPPVSPVNEMSSKAAPQLRLPLDAAGVSKAAFLANKRRKIAPTSVRSGGSGIASRTTRTDHTYVTDAANSDDEKRSRLNM